MTGSAKSQRSSPGVFLDGLGQPVPENGEFWRGLCVKATWRISSIRTLDHVKY